MRIGYFQQILLLFELFLTSLTQIPENATTSKEAKDTTNATEPTKRAGVGMCFELFESSSFFV